MTDQSQTQSQVSDAGEDDSSTERDGDDSHLHEDQKSPSSAAAQKGGDAASGADDRTKTQDLAKAGRTDFDPDQGQE